MKRGLFILFSGFLMFLVSFVWAEDSKLVEAAKKEKERREKIKNARVITNQDIEEFKKKNKEAGGESQTQTQEGEDTTAATEDTSASTDQQLSPTEQEEQAWRQKYQQAADRVVQAQNEVDKLQTDIDAATNAYYIVDGLQQLQLEQQRAVLIERLQTARGNLAAAQQAMENLQDQAHKEGVPPGWVRE